MMQYATSYFHPPTWLWKHMVLELHGGKIQGFDELPTPQEETYFAVEYQKSFYIGRVLQRSDDSHAMYKFLHKCSSQMFDWPKRDDIETCHDPCVFYGPVSVVGNAPFTSPQLMEIDQVFNWLRKSRKTKKWSNDGSHSFNGLFNPYVRNVVYWKAENVCCYFF